MNSPHISIKNKIELSELSSVEQPITKAKGLPNAAYTDHTLFEFERDYILSKTWTAISFIHDLEDNMVKPIDFMGLPILLTRSKQGQIKVFHNVCSHRGMKLVEEKRKTNGLIVCPYHSWTYTVEGNLKATPHIGGVGVHTVEGFKCEHKGLKEIRSHIWLGILFINIDGNAMPFEDDAKVAIEHARNLMGETAESLLRAPTDNQGLDINVKCNWKLVIENNLEAYHLPFIHPKLNSYSPLSEHDCIVYGEKYAGQITTTFDPKLDAKTSLPLFPDWHKPRLQFGEYPTLYPNLLLGFQANHIFAIIIHPVSATKCFGEVALFYVGDAATDARYQKLREENLKAWTRIFSEDVGPCEGMQLGRQSPGYQGGAFSPALDKCSYHFHQWIAQHYKNALN